MAATVPSESRQRLAPHRFSSSTAKRTFREESSTVIFPSVLTNRSPSLSIRNPSEYSPCSAPTFSARSLVSMLVITLPVESIWTWYSRLTLSVCS